METRLGLRLQKWAEDAGAALLGGSSPPSSTAPASGQEPGHGKGPCEHPDLTQGLCRGWFAQQKSTAWWAPLKGDLCGSWHSVTCANSAVPHAQT